MLVLTRRIGEEVIISGNIHVRVIGVQGAKVRLAVEAPASIPVDRREIHERRAAATAPCVG